MRQRRGHARGRSSGKVAFWEYVEQIWWPSRHALYRPREGGMIEPLGRGIYRRADGELADHGLIAIATAAPSATLCLSSALARHGLSDDIPAAPDIALPRGSGAPAVLASARRHFLAADTFAIGRSPAPVDRVATAASWWMVRQG